MKVRSIGAAVLGLCLMGGVAQAGLPKPVSMLDKTTTSQSRGVGFQDTKYNKPSWGVRWKQNLGQAPVILSPGIRAR